MRYGAILFDLDGTLTDTIGLYLDAFLEALTEIGLTPPKEQFLRWYMEGWHLKDILEHFQISESRVPALRMKRDLFYERALRTQVEWMPGGKELLANAVSLSPVGIVTGSWRKYVDAIEACLPVLEGVKTLVTADDMGDYMKPHPHGLLFAADRLNVAPESCIYIGDQSFDAAAARAAGMRCCILIGPHSPHDAGKNADHVVKTLEDIMKII